MFASLLWNKNSVFPDICLQYILEKTGIVNGAYGKVPMGSSREAEKEKLAISINIVLFDSFFLL